MVWTPAWFHMSLVSLSMHLFVCLCGLWVYLHTYSRQSCLRYTFIHVTFMLQKTHRHVFVLVCVCVLDAVGEQDYLLCSPSVSISAPLSQSKTRGHNRKARCVFLYEMCNWDLHAQEQVAMEKSFHHSCIAHLAPSLHSSSLYSRGKYSCIPTVGRNSFSLNFPGFFFSTSCDMFVTEGSKFYTSPTRTCLLWE